METEREDESTTAAATVLEWVRTPSEVRGEAIAHLEALSRDADRRAAELREVVGHRDIEALASRQTSAAEALQTAAHLLSALGQVHDDPELAARVAGIIVDIAASDDPEPCEGCGQLATTHDADMVPLCTDCANELVRSGEPTEVAS